MLNEIVPPLKVFVFSSGWQIYIGTNGSASFIGHTNLPIVETSDGYSIFKSLISYFVQLNELRKIESGMLQ